MTLARRAAELAAIVALFVMARVVVDALQYDVLASTSGLVWCGLWSVVIVAASFFMPRPRVWPPREVWTRVTLAIVVAVLLATDYLYGFKLTHVVTGDIPLHGPLPWEITVTTAIAGPLVEEWLFRGVLWQATEDRAGTAGAFVLTSLLFGVWHWASILRPSWTSGVGVPIYQHVEFGALMGVLRWRLRSLGGGLAVHALYNGLYVVTG
jgi:membrane protease YdiL (CAAX protease family)